MSITLARWLAHREIDDAAGQARLRYITDVPGQQAVYMTKLQQAEAYAAAVALDEETPVPPYIAAEADATDQTPMQVTQTVLTLGAAWNEQIGPAIEGARMGGKKAVTAAQTPESVQTALDAAIAALAAL